ncbi:THAP domain-containing protein 5-like [Bombina bombina]|uniref:THAP domain-containing protein 5-like n=1 Tax=Bombina bombina TaxID=8345 RepID=UPI00235AF8B2|nr:THAP domain-containing protein 5-like [Bombina bombina]
MPECIVIGCLSSTKKGRSNPSVSLHVFPKTHERIRLWLRQTNQYRPEEIEQMVQLVYETNKSSRYRMCSLHFHPDSYYTHGVSRYLKDTSIPTIFPSRIYNSGNTSATVESSRVPTEQTNLPSTSIAYEPYVYETRERIHICHACGQHVNQTKVDATTNTENKNQKDQSTDFNPLYATLNASVQTIPTISKNKTRSTTTKDLNKMIDKYTWTMGDVGSESSVSQFTFSQPTMHSSTEIQSAMISPTSESNMDIVSGTEFEAQASIDNENQGIAIVQEQETLNTDEESIESLEISPIQPMDEDLKDITYNPETTEETADEFSILFDKTNEDYVRERKFIVFENCLDDILKLIPCQFKITCNAPIMSINKRLVGTMLVVTGDCEAKHNSTLWVSQPTIGNRPIGNIMACSSILFSGNQFDKIHELFEYFGVSF